MASYGYKPPTFGRFNGYPHSPGASPVGAQRYTSGVASALAGHSPLTAHTTGYGGYQGYQALNPQQPAAPPASHQPAPQQPPASSPTTQPQPPSPGAYDLNADPVLMQITALAGRSDADAQAGALAQRQQLLLGYGDPQLASSVLGASDPFVQAAGQNPTSVLAGLGHQHDQNIQSYENSLDPSLFYSGARVLGLGEQDRAYQDALAQAAQQENAGLNTIAGNLAAALGQNQQQRIQGTSDAYSRAVQEALAGGYVPGGGTGSATDAVGGTTPTDTSGGNNATYTTPGLPLTADDYLTALRLALANRRAVAM